MIVRRCTCICMVVAVHIHRAVYRIGGEYEIYTAQERLVEMKSRLSQLLCSSLLMAGML